MCSDVCFFEGNEFNERKVVVCIDNLIFFQDKWRPLQCYVFDCWGRFALKNVMKFDG